MRVRLTLWQCPEKSKHVELTGASTNRELLQSSPPTMAPAAAHQDRGMKVQPQKEQRLPFPDSLGRSAVESRWEEYGPRECASRPRRVHAPLARSHIHAPSKPARESVAHNRPSR